MRIDHDLHMRGGKLIAAMADLHIFDRRGMGQRGVGAKHTDQHP